MKLCIDMDSLIKTKEGVTPYYKDVTPNLFVISGFAIIPRQQPGRRLTDVDNQLLTGLV